jgi:serine phosphatase RsbU (regulator of sigma subunit)
MKHILRICIFFVCCCLKNTGLVADTLPQIVIRNNTENLSILSQTQVFYVSSKEKAISFEQISSMAYDARFVPFNKEKLLFKDNDIVWLRFSIENKSESAHWLVDLGTQYDSAAIFFMDKAQNLHTYTDGSMLFKPQKVKYYGFFSYLPLELSVNSSQTYYLRLEIYKSISLQNKKTLKNANNIVIQNEKTVAEDYEQRKYFVSAFAAIYVIMAFYTFVLFLHFRDKSYLFFALMLFSSGLVTIFPLDTLNGFLGFNKVQESYFYFTIIVLPWFFLLFFTRYYLQLSIYAPFWDKIVWGLIGLIGIYYTLAIVFNVWIIILTIIISALVILIVLITSIIVSAKGFRPARYFLLANIFYLVGRLIGMLAIFYVINSKFLMLNASSIGGIIQIFLFSVGLLYRLEIMRQELAKEKEEKQRMIESEKERLEKEVQARTTEIEMQKRTLKQKNEELLASEEELRQNMEELETNQEVIKKQRDTLEKAFEELEIKNIRITDSIRYAKRIQSAILPDENIFHAYFQEHFVIFKPKDVVSGDFYWFEELGDLKFFAVVDCTGHGVPGAFMSMIGHTLLNEIINNKHIYEPNLILEQLHTSIVETLNQQQNTLLQDGMDIALCCIKQQDERDFSIKFSGAKMPLSYFSNAELVEIEGDKTSIGQGNAMLSFQQYEFILQKGDTIYMKTDGTKDIISPKKIRFGSSRIREMLKKSAYLPLQTQKEIILSQIDEFQGNAEQRDDILIVGVKL